MSSRLLIVLTLILLGVASGCKKNRNPYFPNVNVNESVYLNNPSSFDLSAPGGWIYHSGGYKGLIVYRRKLTGASDDFIAYDRGCPEHYTESCGQLEVDEEDELYLKCPCNGERYLLIDGSPSKGASLPLVAYSTVFDGVVIYISN